MIKPSLSWLWLSLAVLAGSFSAAPLNAQTINSVPVSNPNLSQRSIPSLPPPQDVIPVPPQTPPVSPPTAPPPQTPSPEPLLQPGPPANPTLPENVPEVITVKQFDVVGSTVFNKADFDKITAPYTNRPISLAELFEVRSQITQLYLDRGYVTSGAYIPPQELDGGVVTIQISEGGLEDIKVTGTRHLNPNYVRRRLAIAAAKPLNQKRLLDALQLLKLNDRLIQNISAELSAGTNPGESLLIVQVTEAPRWNAQITLDNGRTPSVGTFRRQLQLTNFDLLGLGDSLSLAYTNTDGSNAVDTNYTIPFNPRNGTISLSGGFAFNHVVEPPFDFLDIDSDSNYVELTVRQPILQTSTREFALGLTASHRESGATLLGGEIPFPSPGSDDQGNTRITVLRFFQEYVSRNSQEVLALRSQFSFGLNALNATIQPSGPPDGNFFAWRGQAQYVRLLAGVERPDTLLLLRGDVQLADRPLVPLEQFGLGGIDSVRGYRQDQLLTDNGVFLSAEVRIPIVPAFRLFNLDAHLQLAPFVDFGHVSNNRSQENPSPSILAGMGVGLRFRLGDRITARFDWSEPLVQISGKNRTLQEQGFYFSLIYNQSF
ncbi:ShlB/FhaC/HecB family hemolysin secretion/activation protein [Kovacikia minuta CCNUW1]|uniref:ShlB/FhaC/HecB family hemolysin secretion/activation protein n=1 Tax=Kovacikia minuta TaxID=2931930 RepID=UPI001CCE154B|nr:ShlB/FhaC/HecB family hemolysin secretion/activation protein [Kovacikia minuta]UBF27674.1 ShlB/FhaC/HecB family hemolysin secretion/activation protein [Kovacikia minuta CCNUW1]